MQTADVEPECPPPWPIHERGTMKKEFLAVVTVALLSACGSAATGALSGSTAIVSPKGVSTSGQQEATSTPPTDPDPSAAAASALASIMADVPDTSGLSQADTHFVTLHSNAGHFTAQQLISQGQAVCDALHSGKSGDQLRDDTMSKYGTPFPIATIDVTASVGRFCVADLPTVLFYDKFMVGGPGKGKIVRDPAHDGVTSGQ
jgi:hypothetical protein